MLIPTTYGWTLFALVISMLCWGSWANMQKASGKHRFELFCFDFSIGSLIAAVLMAASLGMLGDDLTFEDNLITGGKRNMVAAFLGGAVFNLGNMLMLAGVSISGMSVAVPISFGISIVISAIWRFVETRQGNPALVFGGIAVLLAAIAASSMAHHFHALATKPRVKNQIGGGIKGIAISTASGVLLGLHVPLAGVSRAGEIGLGPYTALVFMAIGAFATTLLYNLYFMNLPVQGEPVKFSAYFAAGKKNHLLGVLGGMIWAIGAAAAFAASTPGKVSLVAPALAYSLSNGACVLAALWGLIAWREFSDATGRAKSLVSVMVFLYVAGLALLSVANLY